MRAGSLGWHDASDTQDAEEKRRLRTALGISLGIHLSLALLLLFGPSFAIRPPPTAIQVELIAGETLGRPAAPKAPARKAARPRKPPPPKAAEPKAKPEPAPEQPAPPKPKVAKVLPENETRPDRKVKQAPEKQPKKEVAKTETKPAEKTAKQEPGQTPDYDDVMKELEAEDGDDALDEVLEASARPAQRTAAESTGAARSQAGVKLDPRMAAWMDEATRLIRSKWVTPSNYRGRGLVTYLQLELAASGALIGTPEVVRSSGDPYFDDTAVAALILVKELPPPPRPGKTSFEFSSDEEY